MEFIKTEPEPVGESYLSSTCDQDELTGVREDKDPLLLKCPLMKPENEVSCFYTDIARICLTVQFQIHLFGTDSQSACL